MTHGAAHCTLLSRQSLKMPTQELCAFTNTTPRFVQLRFRRIPLFSIIFLLPGPGHLLFGTEQSQTLALVVFRHLLLLAPFFGCPDTTRLAPTHAASGHLYPSPARILVLVVNTRRLDGRCKASSSTQARCVSQAACAGRASLLVRSV